MVDPLMGCQRESCLFLSLGLFASGQVQRARGDDSRHLAENLVADRVCQTNIASGAGFCRSKMKVVDPW
jgi:hypothetical protein